MKFQIKLQFDKTERQVVERGFHFWGTRSEDLEPNEVERKETQRLVNRLIDGAVIQSDLDAGVVLLQRIRWSVEEELKTLAPYRDSPRSGSPNALILDPAMAVATIERCRTDQMKDVREVEQLFAKACAKLNPLTAIAEQILPSENCYDDQSADEEV